MLENFSDDEIEDMINTGYIWHEDGRQIDTSARYNRRGKIIGTIYDYHESKPIRYEPYVSLASLMRCEHITFDDIRREWRYHGVLFGSPVFSERLSHNKGCPCCLCHPENTTKDEVKHRGHLARHQH
jgi:hypothetical protein